MKCNICKHDVPTVHTERGMQLHKKFKHDIPMPKMKKPAAKQAQAKKPKPGSKRPMGKSLTDTERASDLHQSARVLSAPDQAYWNPEFHSIPLPAMNELTALIERSCAPLAGWFERARQHQVPEEQLETLRNLAVGALQQALHPTTAPTPGVMPEPAGASA